MRSLPDFTIIGAQKCGTTSLYRYLTQHRCVIAASVKEVRFYNRNFRKGITWYRSHFPTLLHKRYLEQKHGCSAVTGEATPSYVFYPHVPARLRQVVPQARLIVLLRDPVTRAYSHYQHQVREGRESLTFEEAIRKEPERLRGEYEKILQDPDYLDTDYGGFSYLQRGIYVDQLKSWQRFFPVDQMLTIKSEELYDDPAAIMGQVLAFLNLPGQDISEFRKYNANEYPEMDQATRERLREYFEPCNRRLYDLLGVDFAWNGH